jgi:flagellar motor switch protein FliG
MTQEASATQISGIEKASLLLISLGSKAAGSVLQHLSSDEVQTLCAQIARQQKVDPLLQTQVLQDFTRSRDVSCVGGLDYAQELLEQALGPAKAKSLMDQIAIGSGGRPFDWLKGSSTSRLASCLQHERPQVIALVLAHLTAAQAAEALALLPEEIQGAVAHRLTAMQPVAPDVVTYIEDILKSKLVRDGATGDLKSVGGLQSLVMILNNADRPTEGKIMQYLEQAESDIAESVKQMMFVFEDILTLDDRAVQAIICDLEQDDLRLSMKGASDEIKEMFFRNMSERAAEALKEDLEMLGPVKRRDVEAAQRRVVAVVRKLDETGEISLRPDSEEVIP